MARWQLWVAGLLPILVLMTAAWAVSVVRRDASVADRVWGIGFIVAMVTYAAAGEGAVARTALVLLLVTVWGLRLSFHIVRRGWGKGEDPRYQVMRARSPDTFPVTSLFRVFWLQALAMWVVSVPLAAAAGRPTPEQLTWLDLLGAVVWLVGFGFEAVGDHQLARFTSDPANRGRVLDTGLWRYTRHPNYFGDALVWWGLFCFGLATGAWWTAIGPALMMFVLMRVSGVAATDRHMAATRERRHGYDAYVQHTNAFFPGPRRGDRG